MLFPVQRSERAQAAPGSYMGGNSALGPQDTQQEQPSWPILGALVVPIEAPAGPPKTTWGLSLHAIILGELCTVQPNDSAENSEAHSGRGSRLGEEGSVP